MARWENEDVSGLNLPDPINISTKYIDKNGKEINTEQFAVAKIVTADDKNTYYIRYGRGEIVDPHHTDVNFNRNESYFKLKKVDEKAFHTYVKFLTTKNRLYFTMARRIVMEII